MKTIKVYTNIVTGGWSPKDLETGIGGSEEKLIEWAKALAKDYDITIYHNGEHGDFDGVHYRDHSEFIPWEHSDIFISFKAKYILEVSIDADKVYHWTTEIETWSKSESETVDKIFVISNYHKNRMQVADKSKLQTMYLWADTQRLDIAGGYDAKDKKHKPAVKEGVCALYSSSFDRGLEELLINWKTFKEKYNVDKLFITYGWNFFNGAARLNPALHNWRAKIENLMKQDGIEYLGRVSNDEMSRLYWQSKYWILPLNNPDSELFCINAIKAQYCGAIPVVRRIGALQETVNDFIDWDLIIGQKHGIDQLHADTIKRNLDHANEFGLDKQIAIWQSELE